MRFGQYFPLFFAAVPFIYYFLAIVSSFQFFSSAKREKMNGGGFTPPVSNLKPVKGLDPEAYKNFASLCRQDYPEYELLFCTTDASDPAVPVIQKLMRDFPDRQIRLLYSAGIDVINDKVAKLGLMTREAKYDYLVINDSDVRVTPDYLRTVVAPFQDSKIGGVTCFYVSTEDKSFVERLQSMGMISDFYAGILVAWKLDGVHYALGPTMVSTKQMVQKFGGFQVLENRPADDLLFGRLLAEHAGEVKVLPYTVQTTPDYNGVRELFAKRARWMTVMRKMRPWGHFGLFFTWGLPWSLFAVVLHPTLAVAVAYLGGYFACRVLITYLIGTYGLKQKGLWKSYALIPFWDALAFLVWLTSFTRSYIRWRGVDYELREGQLVLREGNGGSRGAAKSAS